MKVTFEVNPCYVAVCKSNEYGWYVLAKDSCSGLTTKDYGCDNLGIPNTIGYQRTYLFQRLTHHGAVFFESKEKAEECVNTLKAKQKVLFLTRDCGEVQVIPYDEYFKLCVERNNPSYPPYPHLSSIVGGGVGKNRVGNHKAY